MSLWVTFVVTFVGAVCGVGAGLSLGWLIHDAVVKRAKAVQEQQQAEWRALKFLTRPPQPRSAADDAPRLWLN